MADRKRRILTMRSIDINKFARQGILDLPVYIPGKPIEEVQREYGLEEVVKMASNENPLGPSPLALKAVKEALSDMHIYPEGPCLPLCKKMAQLKGIGEDMVTFANGADNIITMMAQSFLNQGDEVVMAFPTFSLYPIVARIMGANPVEVPLKDHVHDLDAMAAKISSRTKMIVICNPNNPTGTVVEKESLDEFIKRAPDDVLIILDEAYFEFGNPQTFPESLPYIREGYPVMSIRTFSKIYGIAGIRIGYAMARKKLIDCLNRVREPFPVNRMAQVAALAALEDDDFREEVLKVNNEGRRFLDEALQGMGMETIPSHTNFIFVDLKRDAKAIFEDLIKRGIIVRPGYIWELPTCMRVTIGTPDQNERLVRALREILETA
jgi:histidinol-phosphate aminotransferase